MRNKKFVGKVAITLSLLIGLSACSGGGNEGESSKSSNPESESSNKITISFFDKNSGSKTFDDEIAKKIMEKTGVEIKVENPSGDPTEKLNLMLTGQNYPDIVLMDRGDQIVNRYIDAGALIPLNDLIDNKTEHIKSMYGDVLNKSRHTDGKNYYLNNWYGVDPDASAGVLMRKDLLSEIVGKERANDPSPFSQKEYVEILNKFKEKYPEINGKESIPLTIDSDSKNFEGTLYGMYGLKTYVKQENDKLQIKEKSPEYIKAVKFMNGLFNDGLLDKNWVSMNKELWTQELSSGRVFSTFASYWDTDAINTALTSSVGEDAKFYSYKIVPEGISPDETTYNGRSTLGWDAIGITKNCKNPEAAIKLIDFLVSEEGQYLMMWGIEGKHWSFDENNIHVPNKDIIDGFLEDFDGTSLETGIRKWTWFIKNGKGQDGTPYDMATKYVLQPTAEFANKVFNESDFYDTAEFAGLEPAGSSPEGLKYQKILDIRTKTFPNLVNTSPDEFEVIYNKMIEEMNSSGLEDIENLISKNYQDRMKVWKE